MRIPLALALVAACGGSSPAPVESPAAPERPAPAAAPAGQPAAPAGQSPSWSDTEVCAQRSDEFGAVTLTASQATGRYGHGATRFDQVMSSKERPVEVCGPSGELDFLFAASCADGSHPFADRSAAHGARRGSVGAGGRCRSIIDHYAVPCPEATYDLYFDMYMCGPGESL